MSTLAIPSLAPLEKQRKSQVRLTPRGRLVARSAVVASLSILLAASASFITGATAGSKESAVSTPYALITVKPGETLWSIASVLAAHGDRRDLVAEISEINHLKSPELQAGQRIYIPTR
ncbi:MAG: LysM peptidoglycan-binding domain-containing protein [Actinobacteria bacterium]|jgi:LysM repeat protein|nr:LysM peptidoglycan-binding domain-containing protein [Actinomycetota bacterium]NCW34654.1 LysM peptidoglycan-binding domain-containing protein [Actinomycetota bacterium]NCZ73322.1 LysM peptidoglycan-binding domain-containing protein [Actinomycetota bacterium]NDA41056.1 LysM peptidoglycan-binding domain-containing protein [Actinomycetota bacterium]NDB31265.1 LysM peptidoglycan-binding domain-containing protein [Actinomycetota bacterium]